jgi:hypothetical protein
MDRNQDLGSNEEISQNCTTDNFCEDKQAEVSNSGDKLSTLYRVEKRQRLSDSKAKDSDHPDQKISKTNDFDNKNFQTDVFQNFGDAEKKEEDLKENIFQGKNIIPRAVHELDDVRKTIKELHRIHNSKVKSIKVKHKLNIEAIKEKYQNSFQSLLDTFQANLKNILLTHEITLQKKLLENILQTNLLEN